MAKNVVIRDVVYSAVPAVAIPQQGGGTAQFYDTSDANASGSDVLPNKTYYGASGKASGSMQTKAAATYTPTTTDQTIAANQYLEGAQTVKGDANLQSQNIVYGVTIFNVQGGAKIPVVSQDSTTKVLSIS